MIRPRIEITATKMWLLIGTMTLWGATSIFNVPGRIDGCVEKSNARRVAAEAEFEQEFQKLPEDWKNLAVCLQSISRVRNKQLALEQFVKRPHQILNHKDMELIIGLFPYYKEDVSGFLLYANTLAKDSLNFQIKP